MCLPFALNPGDDTRPCAVRRAAGPSREPLSTDQNDGCTTPSMIAVSLKSATCGFKGVRGLLMSTPSQLRTESFTQFVKEVEARLQHALVARYGVDLGRESAAEALAYAWEHWEKVEPMVNPVGYLYRTATSRSRRIRRPTPALPEVAPDAPMWVEPSLPRALERLSANQRTAILLVYSFEYTHSEAADAMAIAGGTLRKHLARGMAKLRSDLEVTDEG